MWDLDRFFAGLPLEERGKVALHSWNARDLGYSSLMLDLEHSRNVTIDTHLAEQPQPLNEWIGLGQSCGIPGGCNNIQPMGIPIMQLKARPALACFKLWRQEDPDPNSGPDCWFVLQLD